MDKYLNKKYDLEERTFVFARDVRVFVDKLPKAIINIDDAKQLIRASGSVAANYIEANESFSRKDFLHRIMICRKEAKEALLWLKLIVVKEDHLSDTRDKLAEEAHQLMLIFSSIMRKTKDLKN